MAAPTLEHKSSFKFQHSSPLDAFVGGTLSPRAQDPRYRPLPLSHPSSLADRIQSSQQQQILPNSPLLHTQFRGSTFSAATNDQNSFLDTSITSNVGRDISQEAEYVYRDDDASVYSTPSMLPLPHPQDRWEFEFDPHSDHAQQSVLWDDAYTGTTSHSSYLPQESPGLDGQNGILDAELLLPTVVISPVVDSDTSSPAIEPTRGGKVPIAAPPKFNFSRPGRPPHLPPENLKRQVIQRNAGRHPARPPPPLSTPLAPTTVIPSRPQNGITGSVLPLSPIGMIDLPQRPAQPLITSSLTGPIHVEPPRNGDRCNPPPSTITIPQNPRSEDFPQPPSVTLIPEMRSSGPLRNFPSDKHALAPIRNQRAPSHQQYSQDDSPIRDPSRSMALSTSLQLLGSDVSPKTSPLHHEFYNAQGSDDVHDSELPRNIDGSSVESSLLPDPSTPSPSNFATYPGSSIDSPDGSPRNMNFFEDPPSSDGISPGMQPLSHWSVDGASILGPPPRTMDCDTGLPSPTGSTISGKKPKKLKKARKDWNGYESDGYVSDGSNKKGKVKGKEIVVLWPELQQDSSSQGPARLDDRRDEVPPRDKNYFRPPPLAIPDPPFASPYDTSHPAEPSLSNRNEWISQDLDTEDAPAGPISFDSPITDTLPTHAQSPSPSLPSPFTAPLCSPHSISLDDLPSGRVPRSMNHYNASNHMGLQQSQLPPALVPLGHSPSSSTPGSMHSDGPPVHAVHALLLQVTSLLPSHITGLHQRPSGLISSNNSSNTGLPQSIKPYESTSTYVQGAPSSSSLLAGPDEALRYHRFNSGSPDNASHSWDADYNRYSASPSANSTNNTVDGSPPSNYSPISLEAPSRPSANTAITTRSPTIELPRGPPSRSTSPAASVYSQYSFYQLDGNNPSPTNSTIHTFPDSRDFCPGLPEEPRPLLLSPHYAPPARFSAARSRCSSPSSTISPTHTPSPRSPQEYLQLGIQHHEANRLKDAAVCFEKSAKDAGGCGVGMVMWGLTLRHGWGCEKNESLGFKWLQRAAESAVTDLESSRKGLDITDVQDELVIAIYEVGQCFFQGWGVRKDLKMAVSYYSVAARLGDADAQQDLGFCLANGRGCKKDRKEAAKWYRAAVAQGASDVGLVIT